MLVNISNAVYNDAEIAAFITVYLMRSVTIAELQGFRDALLELAMPLNIGEQEVMDIVGTGGDGKNTFNISTLSCFIVAGTGNKVAKHGNYGASSISGSSNVMEQLGYRFTTDEKIIYCFIKLPFYPGNYSANTNCPTIARNCPKFYEAGRFSQRYTGTKPCSAAGT